MKKLSTLALTALFALSGTVSINAQEEDVTHYIVNAGFDEDFTFNEDGSWKEIVNKDKSFSDRTQAWMAADSTVYAHTKSTSSQNRADGRKDEAVNGFFGQIKGWTAGDKAHTGKTYWPYGSDIVEWVYFGCIPYALSPQSVPIADDGTTYLEVPEKPADYNTEDNKGFIYLRAGWGGAATYKQVVKLPCAQYRLEYWAINTNPSATKGENLSRVVCRKDVFTEDGAEALTAQEWTKHTIEFTPTSEFTIEFGFKSDGGSGANPFLCIDGIKLYKIGEADAVELLTADINDEITELEDLVNNDTIANYPGLCDAINDAMMYEGDTEEELTQALKDVKAFKAEVIALKETITDYENLLLTAQNLLENTEYPGLNDFNDAINNVTEAATKANIEEFSNCLADLQKAINNYYMSQKATPENPADYTFLIPNPYFTKTKASPTIFYTSDGAVEYVDYPNVDAYNAGSAPEDGNSTGWYKAGTTEGDQRLNYVQGRVCWNAWRTNAEDIAVATDLTDIPNGYYKVSAEMITQADYVSNQHVYAKSNVQSVVSPSLTSGNWADDNTGTWDNLTTETILVHDGKLTIGASGSAIDGSTNQTGWFCVTNFRLQYLGEATEEEVAAAVTKRFADVEEYINSLHFAADKAKALADAAGAKALADLDSLNTVLKFAETSEAEYNGIIVGTYKGLQDSIQTVYSANAAKLAQVPVDYMTNYLPSANATYTEAAKITPILRYYRDTLIPAVQEAEAVKETISAENGKAVIDGTIASVTKNLAAYTDSTEYLDEQVAALKKAIALANITDIEIAAGSDVTAYITNPNIDSNSATGWTYNKIAGNHIAGSGQGINGSGSYLDTYNSEGKLRETIYQVLEVPNGTYTIKNIMRTASDGGVYLFATDKALLTADDEEKTLSLDPAATSKTSEAVKTPINVTTYLGVTTEEGNDSIYTGGDMFGSIWAESIKTLQAAITIELGNPEYTITDQIEDQKADSFVPTEEQEELIKIIEANGGKGYGWTNNSITGFEVKNHVLVIGVTCDYKFLNKTEDTAYTGTWFSADNFQLILESEGDNTGWDPTTGIASAENAAPAAPAAIFSISGARLNGLQKGINIIKGTDGKVKKIFVK